MEKTDLNAVYNVYIYKFNLPGGGDNKHSSLNIINQNPT